MGTQEYRANYLAAMHEANSQLANIFREFEQLQLRMALIEDVVGALEPFLPATSAPSYEPTRHEPVMSQPQRYEPEVPAPAAVALEPVFEPVAPASFAPVPDLIVDPIQSRINRALGLAVA